MRSAKEARRSNTYRADGYIMFTSLLNCALEDGKVVSPPSYRRYNHPVFRFAFLGKEVV